MNLQLQTRTNAGTANAPEAPARERPVVSDVPASHKGRSPVWRKAAVIGPALLSVILLAWCLMVRRPLLEEPVVVHARPVNFEAGQSLRLELESLKDRLQAERRRLIEDREELLKTLGTIERLARSGGWEVRTSILPALEPVADLDRTVRLPVTLSLQQVPGNSESQPAFYRLIPFLNALQGTGSKMDIVELNAQGNLEGIDAVALKLEFWMTQPDEKMAPR